MYVDYVHEVDERLTHARGVDVGWCTFHKHVKTFPQQTNGSVDHDHAKHECTDRIHKCEVWLAPDNDGRKNDTKTLYEIWPINYSSETILG